MKKTHNNIHPSPWMLLVDYFLYQFFCDICIALGIEPKEVGVGYDAFFSLHWDEMRFHISRVIPRCCLEENDS